MHNEIYAHANHIVQWLQINGVDYGFRILGSLIIFIVGWVAIKLLAKGLAKTLGKVKGDNALLIRFVTSVVVKLCWAFLFVIILGKLGVEVGPLIAGLGATGLIIGFACQESLGSLAAGVMIALNHPFKVGDFVVIAGHEGVVTTLDMMAVVLTTGDQRRITIPNKSAWGAPIVNFSALEKRRADFSIGIDYDEDIDRAMKVALDAIATVPGALTDPAPTAAVGSLDDSEVTIGFRVWCRNADFWPVRNAAVKAVKLAFDREHVEMPFPQIVVHNA